MYMISKRTVFAAFAAVMCALGSMAQNSNVAYKDGYHKKQRTAV